MVTERNFIHIYTNTIKILKATDRSSVGWRAWKMNRVFSILTTESYSHGRKQSDMCAVTYKNLPLKCLGQHTNSTPLNKEMPQGRSMAKDRSWSPRSWQALPAVAFQRPNVQQLL
jgi:hypothetical protein